jgi:anti-anti-sigma factor
MLSLRAEPRPDDTVVITVAGVVEYHNAQQIAGAVHAAIARWTPITVLIDIGEVCLLDSAGIAALLASHQTAAAAAVNIAVLNPNSFIARQLRVYGVADLLCPQMESTHEQQTPLPA